MSKRLVVCCDGTWNDPKDRTHVHWIWENCRRHAGQDTEYIAGVGTALGEELLGGLKGAGLSEDVRTAYEWILKRWDPGDELFVFGFSRGAYTARSLCGFIGRVGMLRGKDPGQNSSWVNAAYLSYRLARPAREGGPSRLASALEQRVEERIGHRPVEVTFLGVFDTVGALGIPVRAEDLIVELGLGDVLKFLGHDMLGAQLGRVEDRLQLPIYGFHDVELGPHVKNAYQALAVDEQRELFVPTMWTKAPPTSTVEQAWFAGVHGDVGGNYGPRGGRVGRQREREDDRHLATVPLVWMLEKAVALGLELVPGALAAQRGIANPLAPQHDSYDHTFQILDRLLHMARVERPIGNAARKTADPTGDKFPLVETNETVHPSVRERVGKTVEVRRRRQSGVPLIYAPGNLPDFL